MRRLLLFPIDIYRKYLSGAKASPCCRFSPSCSNYAYRAISEWGAVVGLLLSCFRILRCNPLFKGGVDAVPRRARRLIPKTRAFKRRRVVSKLTDPPKYPYLSYYGRYL